MLLLLLLPESVVNQQLVILPSFVELGRKDWSTDTTCVTSWSISHRQLGGAKVNIQQRIYTVCPSWVILPKLAVLAGTV